MTEPEYTAALARIGTLCAVLKTADSAGARDELERLLLAAERYEQDGWRAWYWQR